MRNNKQVVKSYSLMYNGNETASIFITNYKGQVEYLAEFPKDIEPTKQNVEAEIKKYGKVLEKDWWL